MELFPPLTRGLRLQLRDDAPLVDAALATHVLDLTQISHSGRAGKCILPCPLPVPVYPGSRPRQQTPSSRPNSAWKVWSMPSDYFAPSRPLPSQSHLSPADYRPYPWFGSVDKNPNYS